MTQNLWVFGGDWPSRREVLRTGLADIKPDLVAFIEAVKTDDYDQAADLLPAGYHFAYQAERGPRHQGATIASRWPIGRVAEVDLHVTPRTFGFECTTLVAEIDLPAPFESVVFANHVPSWQPQFERERELQAVAAVQALEERARGRNVHVIVGGDFTADPESANVRFWTGRQSLEGRSACYRDAWQAIHGNEPGDTFTPANPLVADWDFPSRRIDYVMVRCLEHGGPTLAVESCARAFDRPVDGKWGSDHFGVVADLVPPPHRPGHPAPELMNASW
jgi:endonuclease/exonuclease/phosphatase family metal-dependent hydrolase